METVPMNPLTITLCQSALHYDDPEKNRKKFDGVISSIGEKTDLIILPEMFTTSFSLNRDLAETMEGPTVRWLLDKAREKDALVTGSLLIREEESYRNRLIAAFPDGSLRHYDKRHRVPMFGEEKIVTAGTDRLLFDWRGWTICPLICYDLRFPVWARNTEGYDLLLYIANWPMPRSRAWDILLRARAIENVAYVAGVNRVGSDPDGQEYFGHSAVIDPLGEEISSIPERGEHTVTVRLDREHLESTRQSLPFLRGMDGSDILRKAVYKK